MCSIMGCFGHNITKDQFLKESKATISRGPDMSKYLQIEDGYLCFHRLAIMGLQPSGMQPFFYNHKFLICNGEIYGFHKLKEELKDFAFVSESDCEILLPLYEKYGNEMFKFLDAEFALIIYDELNHKIIAARDPLGIRPLFYGYNKNNSDIGFASEAKCLNHLYDIVLPFPPGYFYEDGKFICYHDISNVVHYHNDNLDVITKKIHDKLCEGVKKRLVSDAKVGFLLSGGLDSSLICSISQKYLKEPIKTFAIGMNTDAIDLKYAKEVADYIGSDHTEIIISVEDVLACLDEVIYTLETYDITTIRASIGMYLLCKKIHEMSDVRVLLTGEISDELFGYKYTDFAPNALEFQKESQKRIKEIYMYDVLRADRCISRNSMESRVPFGDLDFVQYVMSINPELKMNNYNKGKFLLRKAFEEGNYLPKSILYREKAAFSDAVGHSMVDYLKDYADKNYSQKDYEEKIEKYSYAKPFTKESLLYREIFEKHYPKRAQMVKDFWMPNKNWEGCNVNDPSARVLSNYGESGE